MRRQRAPIGATLLRAFFARLGVVLFHHHLALGNGLLEVLERQLQLLLGQAPGFRAELHPPQLQQQMTQPVILDQ